MAWRFRKSINLGAGMRINLSKSGPSFSFGRRGARVTIGKRGVTRSVGIPGTGIYNTKTYGWKKKKNSVKASAVLQKSYTPRPRKQPEITAKNFSFLNVPPSGSGKFLLIVYLPLALAFVALIAACAAWPFVFLALALLIFAIVNLIRHWKKFNAYHWISQAIQKYPQNKSAAFELIHRAEPIIPECSAVPAFLGMEALARGDDAAAREYFEPLPEIYRNDKNIAHVLGVVRPVLAISDEDSAPLSASDTAAEIPSSVVAPPELPAVSSPDMAAASLSSNLEVQPLHWYQRTLWIVVLLIVFFPAGLILMLKFKRDWPKGAKVALTSVFGIWFIFSVLLVAIGSSSSPSPSEPLSPLNVSSATAAAMSSAPSSSTAPSSSSASSQPALRSSSISSENSASSTMAAAAAAKSARSSAPAPKSSSAVSSRPAAPAASSSASSASALKIISITHAVSKGEYARITVHGRPNTEYAISVEYDSGRSKSGSLGDKTSDSSGEVSWAWKVGPGTKSASASVNVFSIDGNDSVSEDISIQ